MPLKIEIDCNAGRSARRLTRVDTDGVPCVVQCIRYIWKDQTFVFETWDGLKWKYTVDALGVVLPSSHVLTPTDDDYRVAERGFLVLNNLAS